MPSSPAQFTSAQNLSQATTLDLIPASDPTAARLLVIGVVSYRVGNTTPATFSVSDNFGSTWAAVPGSRRTATISGFSDSWAAECFYALAGSGSGYFATVTASSNDTYLSAAWAEVSGNSATQPGGANTGAGTGTAPAAGSVSLTGDADVIFGFASHAGTSATTITPGSGWSQGVENEGVSGMPFNFEYKAGVQGSSQAADWTLSQSWQWISTAAAFNGDGVPPPPPPPPARYDYSDHPRPIVRAATFAREGRR